MLVGNMTSGTLNVTASGSIRVEANGTHYVGGNSALGVLNLSGNGRYSSSNAMTLGSGASASGVINLNGGVLEVPQLLKGAGGATLNANGGILQASAGSANFLQNVTTNILAGGLYFSTDGHTVTLANVLSGAGGLTKTGAGTLLLNGENTYAGDTTVSGGTLEIGNVSALGARADLSIASGALVNLNYSGAIALDSLLLDSSVIGTLTVGQDYNAAQLNTLLGASIFGGDGLLNVSVIPEPTTFSLLLLAGGGLVLLSLAWRQMIMKTITKKLIGGLVGLGCTLGFNASAQTN
jgi:autotransporter-associated beta strand protein